MSTSNFSYLNEIILNYMLYHCLVMKVYINMYTYVHTYLYVCIITIFVTDCLQFKIVRKQGNYINKWLVQSPKIIPARFFLEIKKYFFSGVKFIGYDIILILRLIQFISIKYIYNVT